MNNLLSNAFKFTPQGGTVLIRVYRNQDEAIVEVQNSGEGISQENIDKIFTRFIRWILPLIWLKELV